MCGPLLEVICCAMIMHPPVVHHNTDDSQDHPSNSSNVLQDQLCEDCFFSCIDGGPRVGELTLGGTGPIFNLVENFFHPVRVGIDPIVAPGACPCAVFVTHRSVHDSLADVILIIAVCGTVRICGASRNA